MPGGPEANSKSHVQERVGGRQELGRRPCRKHAAHQKAGWRAWIHSEAKSQRNMTWLDMSSRRLQKRQIYRSVYRSVSSLAPSCQARVHVNPPPSQALCRCQGMHSVAAVSVSITSSLYVHAQSRAQHSTAHSTTHAVCTTRLLEVAVCLEQRQVGRRQVGRAADQTGQNAGQGIEHRLAVLPRCQGLHQGGGT